MTRASPRKPAPVVLGSVIGMGTVEHCNAPITADTCCPPRMFDTEQSAWAGRAILFLPAMADYGIALAKTRWHVLTTKDTQ